MRIEDQRTILPPVNISINNINIGTVFTGAIGSGSTRTVGVFLRTFAGVVDLEKPIHTWGSHGLDVTNFQPRAAKLVLEP